MPEKWLSLVNPDPAWPSAAGFQNIQYTRKPAAPLLTPNLQDPMWKAAVELIGEKRINELADTVFSYSITAEKK